ncbi:hypothetical protein [Brenneria uluponensis]|uniref:hypothetical protein n=1 Tax=Brenneria uluponensis TaxID=3057057 RepID=UPI0028E8D8C3|nr:hypothetical protein [Brenneria ulupoensis]
MNRVETDGILQLQPRFFYLWFYATTFQVTGVGIVTQLSTGGAYLLNQPKNDPHQSFNMKVSQRIIATAITVIIFR